MSKKESNRQRLRNTRHQGREFDPTPLAVKVDKRQPRSLKEQVAMQVKTSMQQLEEEYTSIEEAFDLDEEGDPEGDEFGLSVYQIEDALEVHGRPDAEELVQATKDQNLIDPETPPSSMKTERSDLTEHSEEGPAGSVEEGR